MKDIVERGAVEKGEGYRERGVEGRGEDEEEFGQGYETGMRDLRWRQGQRWARRRKGIRPNSC